MTDKLSKNIKDTLEASELPENIRQSLKQQRMQILDEMEESSHPKGKPWFYSVASAAAVLILGFLLLPNIRLVNTNTDVDIMPELSIEELEMISTMTIEEMESLEFYHWLVLQEQITG